MRNVKLQDIIQMTRYQSVDREDSMITAYGIGRDFIRIQIENRNVYRYTNASTGKEYIKQMKGCAEAGELDDFFKANKDILNSYEAREM